MLGDRNTDSDYLGQPRLGSIRLRGTSLPFALPSFPNKVPSRLSHPPPRTRPSRSVVRQRRFSKNTTGLSLRKLKEYAPRPGPSGNLSYSSCSVKFLRFQIVRPVTGRQQQASKNHDTSTKWHSLLGSHPAQMSHESRAILNRLSI
ncbi:hypothetical protein CGCF415_v007566 [Colletotrichum fructicola]|nr:hypothetical protein CGCFRS4_v012255 [Colletotrichum fructicola]KAF4907167.1 hypothetical protein CGCF415_v007566 [Colletotrichum fructicola]KAF4936764.1 hypothetical protein CGCF245_v006360 [Colletotrichum fructicola]